MGDYGDYSRPTTTQDAQTAEAVRSTQSPKTLNPSDPKTAGVSLEILSKAQQSPATSPGKSLTDGHEVQSEPSTEGAPSLIHSVSTPILHSTQHPTESHVSEELLQADLHRMNSVRSDLEHPVSKFEGKSDDDLNAALDNPDITDAEIDEILEELTLREDQAKMKESELSQEKTIETKNNVGLIKNGQTKEIQAVANETAAPVLQIKNARILENGKFRLITPDDLKNNKTFASLNAETGVLSLSKKEAAQFQIGQTIDSQDEFGNPIEVTITAINILSEEQLNAFRGAFIAQNPQVQTQEERNPSETHRNEFHPRTRDSATHANTTQTTAQQQHPRTERASSEGVQASTGKSTKQINEERLKKLNEAIETKLEQIKKEVKNREITNTEIKRDALNQAIKKDNVTYEELQATFEKQNAEYEELMGKIRQKSGGIEIPLATIEQFQDIAVEFDQVAKMVPTFKSTNKEIPEALMETVSLKTQVMKVITDMINTSGTEVRAGTGHEGKTAAPAA